MTASTPWGHENGGGVRRSGHKTTIGLLVALVAFIVGAAGNYFVASATTVKIGPASCESSNLDCIPGLEPERVLNALKAKGHNCSQSDDGLLWTCTLMIGRTTYEFTLYGEGGIESYGARVGSPSGTPMTKKSMAYLQWAATLTYSHNPAFAEQIRTWLLEQVQRGTIVKANVGEYGYELDASDPDTVTLDVRTVVPTS